MASVIACSPMSSIMFLISTERSATSRSMRGVNKARGIILEGDGVTGREGLKHTDSDLSAVGAHELDLLHLSHSDGSG